MSKRVKCCNLPLIFLAQLISSLRKLKKKLIMVAKSILEGKRGVCVEALGQQPDSGAGLLSREEQLHHHPFEVAWNDHLSCLVYDTWKRRRRRRGSSGEEPQQTSETARLLPSHVPFCSLLFLFPPFQAAGRQFEEHVSPQLPICRGQWAWLKGSSLLDFTHHINHIDQPPERQHIVWE